MYRINPIFKANDNDIGTARAVEWSIYVLGNQTFYLVILDFSDTQYSVNLVR